MAQAQNLFESRHKVSLANCHYQDILPRNLSSMPAQVAKRIGQVGAASLGLRLPSCCRRTDVCRASSRLWLQYSYMGLASVVSTRSARVEQATKTQYIPSTMRKGEYGQFLTSLTCATAEARLKPPVCQGIRSLPFAFPELQALKWKLHDHQPGHSVQSFRIRMPLFTMSLCSASCLSFVSFTLSLCSFVPRCLLSSYLNWKPSITMYFSSKFVYCCLIPATLALSSRDNTCSTDVTLTVTVAQ